MAWHIVVLSRREEMPLHELTGHKPPEPETDEEREERIYRNSMAWVIVTGGQIEEDDSPKGMSDYESEVAQT